MSDYHIKNGQLHPKLKARLRWGWLDFRRALARAWKRRTNAVYEWLWP